MFHSLYKSQTSLGIGVAGALPSTVNRDLAIAEACASMLNPAVN